MPVHQAFQPGLGHRAQEHRGEALESLRLSPPDSSRSAHRFKRLKPSTLVGQNPDDPVSIRFNPTTQIGSKMGDEFTYQPKWDPIGFGPQPSDVSMRKILQEAWAKWFRGLQGLLVSGMVGHSHIPGIRLLLSPETQPI